MSCDDCVRLNAKKHQPQKKNQAPIRNEQIYCWFYFFARTVGRSSSVFRFNDCISIDLIYSVENGTIEKNQRRKRGILITFYMVRFRAEKTIGYTNPFTWKASFSFELRRYPKADWFCQRKNTRIPIKSNGIRMVGKFKFEIVGCVKPKLIYW